MKAVAPMAMPAQKMEIPSDMVTYATADLEETMKIFMKHGLRFLSPEEIAQQMPALPHRGITVTRETPAASLSELQ
jgi:hypothetical protein